MRRGAAAVLAVLLLCAAVFVRAAEDAAAASSEPTDVIVGTDENFAGVLAENKYVFVKFYAPWCGHCKNMAPAFVEAAAKLKGRAALVEVDATVQTELAKEHKIESFPQLRMFIDGQKVGEYNGARDTASLVRFVENQWTPPAQVAKTAEEAAAIVSGNPGKHIVFTAGAEGSEGVVAFERSARRLREELDAVFVVAADAESAAALGATQADVKDGVVFVRNGEIGDVSSTSDLAALDTFVNSNTVPLLSELSQSTARTYQRLGLPLLLTFVDPAADNEAVSQQLRATARNFRGKVAFVTVDGKKLARFAQHVGVGPEMPAHAIHLMNDDVTFKYDGSKDLADFVQDYVDGKLVYKRKSEPIPASQDGPVFVLVGDAWDEVVGGDKDVLVEQYAPWCGHCKKLEPTYAELAKELAGVSTLRIAKMDGTLNEAPAPYKARGFPTIHFFPAGKTTGVQYQGNREKSDLLKFMAEHATHKFEVPAAAAASGDDDDHSDL